MNNLDEKEIIKMINLHLNVVENFPWATKGICYIGLAYEYFNLGKDQEGIDLILEIPEDFYSNHLQHALSTNPQFLKVTLLLIDFMMKSSHVPKDSDLMKSFFKLKGQMYGNA